MRTSREVKRLESVSRSPVFGSLLENIAGLMVLRAYRLQLEVRQSFERVVNRNTTMYVISSCDCWDAGEDCCQQLALHGRYFWWLATARWFGFRLDMICVLFLVVATYGALMCVEVGSDH